VSEATNESALMKLFGLRSELSRILKIGYNEQGVCYITILVILSVLKQSEANKRRGQILIICKKKKKKK
jgi:hypothetical protein